MRQHDRLHAGTTHLVDGRAGSGLRQAGGKRGLTGGSLTLARRQDAAKNHFLDVLGRNPGTNERRRRRGGAQTGGGKVLELALKAANRRARGGGDDDRIGVRHGFSFLSK
jgi:hypothetical protein